MLGIDSPSVLNGTPFFTKRTVLVLYAVFYVSHRINIALKVVHFCGKKKKRAEEASAEDRVDQLQ
jgi:hypothetical protein